MKKVLAIILCLLFATSVFAEATYRITRAESRKDKNNKDEIFVNVEINDGQEVYNRAEWLTPPDVALIQKDNANLNLIAEQIAQRAILNRTAQKAQIEASEIVQKELRLKEIELAIEKERNKGK